MRTRNEMWSALGTREVDLLVVGGGIVGAGIARDAARRGLDVAVVEMQDLAWGTSSRSSKLVHGGVRYLEQYEFGLVFESVSERRILMDLAPHLVNPLGFLFPVYKGAKHKLWVINAGMWLYDGLSLFRSPRVHKNLSPREVEALEPAVRQEGLKGAPLYWDCSTDDARLTIETAIDAAAHGATIATWSKVESFVLDDGKVRGALVRDAFSGETKTVRARLVVNATGPWTDRTLALANAARPAPLLRPTKGVHIVVDAAKLPVSNAVVCTHPIDKRVLFVIPWGDRAYVGTTDTDFEGDPGDVHATRRDVDYLLAATREHFPDFPLTHADIIATWAGIRPLIAPPPVDAGQTASEVSREHEILMGPNGVLTVGGGKLTTYRRMAAEAVDNAVRWLELSGGISKPLESADTAKHPLPGAEGWPEDDDHAAVGHRVLDASKGTLSEASAQYLANTYGMRALVLADRVRREPKLGAPLVPGRPEILGQVDWAVTEELAASVSDVMTRRTQLFYRDHDQGLGAAEAVGQRMQALLGWTPERFQEEVDRYRQDVALSRQWRDE
ncbi:MAG: glycerol-3-phosphate dehydrogenase [Polyangiales bacterium]